MNFEKNFNELGSRFLDYLKYKGLKSKDVAEIMDYSASQISNIIKGKVFGSDKLFNILNNYTDLNADWLFTGKGQMIKKNNNEPLNSVTTTFKEDLNTNELELIKRDLETARTILESKNQTIDTQRDLINNLKSEIQRLTTDISNIKVITETKK